MAPPRWVGAVGHVARGHFLAAVHRALALLVAVVPALLLTGCRPPPQAEAPFKEVLNIGKIGTSDPKCPRGFISHDGHMYKGGQLEAYDTIEDCVKLCEDWSDCYSVEYSPSEKLCIKNTLGGKPEAGKLRDYVFCEKPVTASLAKLLYNKEEYVEQEGAQIPAGGNVRVYVMGSSNVLWMTWIDQLHLYLLRLGYKVPTIPAKTNSTHYPTEPQTCDDSKYFTALKTSRLGKIGWHSWDFAYDNWSDCLEDSPHQYGYRYISNYKVKCEHGPGCHFGRAVVPAGGIAKDASWSDITLVSTWFNDDQPDARKCFYGQNIPRKDIANMSIHGLLRTTRSIHERNPDVWVLVLAKYSNLRHWKSKWVDHLHNIIKSAVEKEPRTLFIQYDQPHPGNWKAWELWQKAHPNHPNCRGSKLMAHSILERLYKEKILARTIKIVDKAKNLVARNCGDLSGAVCHTSVLCWEDPADKKCKPYSGGSLHYYKHDELLGRQWSTEFRK